MKKNRIFVFLCILVLFCVHCSRDASESKIVSKINAYDLTLDEFQRQLTLELELDDEFKITQETKKQFLEELIRKELLIQEAKRLKLDQEKKFMQTIERYWESTLIRNLVDLKSQEITKKAYVSQEEIKAHYREMEKKNPELPAFINMEKIIEKKLKEQKKSQQLKEWINTLREKADVEISLSLL